MSQYRNVPLIQIAEWTGVYGVSMLLVMVNGALGLTALEMVVPLWRGERGSNRVHVELLFSMALLVAVLGYGMRRTAALTHGADMPVAKVIRCAAVQANVPQDEKWSDELAADVRERFLSLSERAGATRPDLIIWPETSVPIVLNTDPRVPTFLNALAEEAGPLLVGAIEGQGDGANPDYFNSALYYTETGALGGVYRKQHLVPFGEYVPLADRIPLLARYAPLGYSCRAGSTGTVFRLSSSDVPFATLICFEDAMAGLARQAVRNGARFLINQTNDGWFEETSEAVQHMSQCVFRSVENRVPTLRCANLGVSCIIDTLGRLDASTAQAVAERNKDKTVMRIDSVSVPMGGFEPTFYTRWGDLPFALPCALVAAVVLVHVGWLGRRRRRHIS
ncbi:MAG: apolipoprotein N-acyltransferase [Verrucomicrobia bacterium]|nr:apolipoprotein N-acyltransferase [Verrucomicrobiota bacterium]